MDTEPTQNVTRLLDLAHQGDSSASQELLPLVYDELRRLARSRLAHEAPGQTLQPTALVHEAYVRLVGGGDEVRWQSRGHFFGAAARAMRRILVERARSAGRLKRGGDGEHRAGRVELDEGMLRESQDPAQMLAIDEALVRLEAYDSRKAEVVMLRYFAGLTIDQVAAAMSMTQASVKAEWAYSRAWLHRELKNG